MSELILADLRERLELEQILATTELKKAQARAERIMLRMVVALAVFMMIAIALTAASVGFIIGSHL